MSTPRVERRSASCRCSRLHRVAAELTPLLKQAAKRDLNYADFLDEVPALQLAAKHLAVRVTMAHFPTQKTLETFDWSFQPSIEPKTIKQLATGRFIANGANVLLLGPP